MIKKFTYIIVLSFFFIVSAVLAQEDEGIMSDSTMTAIVIGVGVIIGLFMIFKIKKSNNKNFLILNML